MKEKSSSDRPAEPVSTERLDGWKEIAAYLKREVRTIQRWERQKGLPVRRHIHDTRATVYAYHSELDCGWNNRHEQLETIEKSRQLSLRRKLFRYVGMAAALVVIGALGVWLYDSQPPEAAGTLNFSPEGGLGSSGTSLGSGIFSASLSRSLCRRPGAPT